jgi:hypothetical protein
MLNNATIGKTGADFTHWRPAFNYRGFKYVTLFIHPDIGAMYQCVQVQPTNPLTGKMTVLVAD